MIAGFLDFTVLSIIAFVFMACATILMFIVSKVEQYVYEDFSALFMTNRNLSDTKYVTLVYDFTFEKFFSLEEFKEAFCWYFE